MDCFHGLTEKHSTSLSPPSLIRPLLPHRSHSLLSENPHLLLYLFLPLASSTIPIRIKASTMQAIVTQSISHPVIFEGDLEDAFADGSSYSESLLMSSGLASLHSCYGNNMRAWSRHPKIYIGFRGSCNCAPWILPSNLWPRKKKSYRSYSDRSTPLTLLLVSYR